METVIVLAATLFLFAALALALRRHDRLFPRGSKASSEKDRRAESWLTKGSGRG